MVERIDLPLGDRVGIMIKDSDGNYTEWDGKVGASLDVVADFEIEGTTVDSIIFTTATNSTVEAITAGAAEYLKVFKIYVSAAATLNGLVQADLGGTAIGGVQSPQLGGQYVLVSTFPDYVLGATDAHLEVKLPASGNDATFIIHYEKVTIT